MILFNEKTSVNGHGAASRPRSTKPTTSIAVPPAAPIRSAPGASPRPRCAGNASRSCSGRPQASRSMKHAAARPAHAQTAGAPRRSNALTPRRADSAIFADRVRQPGGAECGAPNHLRYVRDYHRAVSRFPALAMLHDDQEAAASVFRELTKSIYRRVRNRIEKKLQKELPDIMRVIGGAR